MTGSPCKDCEKRLVTEDYNCHSHCEAYIQFAKSCRKMNQKIQKERWIYGYYRERVNRAEKQVRNLKKCPQYRNRMK